MALSLPQPLLSIPTFCGSSLSLFVSNPLGAHKIVGLPRRTVWVQAEDHRVQTCPHKDLYNLQLDYNIMNKNAYTGISYCPEEIRGDRTESYMPTPSQTPAIQYDTPHSQYQSHHQQYSHMSHQEHDATMSSMGNLHANHYSETSRRSPQGENDLDMPRMLTSFTAPGMGIDSTASHSAGRSYSYLGRDINSPMMDDRRPSMGFPLSPPQHHATLLNRRHSEGHFTPHQRQAPSSSYFAAAVPHGMPYPATESNLGPTSATQPDDASHILSSYRGVIPPGPSATVPYHSMLPSDGSHPSGIVTDNQVPQLVPSSIPMRKASSDWMSHNSYLSVPELHNGQLDPQSNLRSSPISTHSSDNAKQIENPRLPSLRAVSPTSFQEDGKSKLRAPSPLPSDEAASISRPVKKKKKSKMHACAECDKKFPRPSGLKTHMNTHTNERPHACTFPGCTRTFTVRSNAKRHMRTHPEALNAIPAESAVDNSAYVVGFSPPVVAPPPSGIIDGNATAGSSSGSQVANPPNYRVRWMPLSLTSRTNAATLKNVSENGQFSDDADDEYEEATVVMPDVAHVYARDSNIRADRGVTSTPYGPLLSASSSNSSLSQGSQLHNINSCACPIPCAVNPCMSLVGSAAPHIHAPPHMHSYSVAPALHISASSDSDHRGYNSRSYGSPPMSSEQTVRRDDPYNEVRPNYSAPSNQAFPSSYHHL